MIPTKSFLFVDKNQRIFQITLLICLGVFVLLGCSKVERPLPTATLAVQTTLNLPLATPTSPSPTSTPSPTVTPTPTATSFVPIMLVANEPLGIQWGVMDSFGVAYYDNFDQNPIAIYEAGYPENGLIIQDVQSMEVIQFLFQQEGELFFQLVDEMLFVAFNKEHSANTIVQALKMPTLEVAWEQSLPITLDLLSGFSVENGALFITESKYDTLPRIYVLDALSGSTLWSRKAPKDCNSPHEAVISDDSVLVDCFDFLAVYHRAEGEFITFLDDFPDSITYDLGIINDQAFILYAIWEPEYVEGFSLPVTVRNWYLEARSLIPKQVTPPPGEEKGADLIIFPASWKISIPAEITDFVLYEEDLIYRDSNHVVRLDGETGTEMWRTEVTGYVSSEMMQTEQWLWVGSGVGYLSLLNANTGELLWEQDIWATIEPRYIRLKPIGVSNTSVLLHVWGRNFPESGLVALGINGQQAWHPPTPTPRSRTPTPTATAFPVFPTPAPGQWVELPESFEDSPAALAAFLNASSANLALLDQQIAHWNMPDLQLSWESADFTGDNRNDLLFVLGDRWRTGMVFVLQAMPDGQFQLVWVSNEDAPSNIEVIQDLNQNGVTDFIYRTTIYGVHTGYTNVYPMSWDGETFVELAVQPIESTNVDQLQIANLTGDSHLEISLHGGTYGSIGAGPNRNATLIFAWTDQGYALETITPDLPQEYYFFLVDANRFLVSGNYEEAIKILESSMDSEDAFAQTDHQRAFAEFQLMLAYLLSGDEETAADWANTGNYPDQLYAEVKQIFWNTYQESRDYSTAAEAARKRIRLAGYTTSQLVGWVGYANEPLTLNDLVPCSTCLQGFIGSDMFP